MARRPRIDVSRIAATAIETALNGEQPQRRRLSGVRAVAAGAVLATGARLVISKAPSLPRVPDLSELTGSVRDRLAEHGWIEHEDAVDDDEEFDEPEDELDEPDEELDEPEDDDEEDEGGEDDEDDGGPEDEAGAELDEEDEEGEEAEEDEEAPDEDESPGLEIGTSEDGGDRRAARAPDLMRVLNERGINPVARPPAPPAQSKAKAGRK
ncbi:MAG TPA: hypothetical protein VH256_02770 [Thermoleophilaceae bacterium]|nr:hypothetical protein [Thermoleophilaceae bacterium]